MLWRAVLCYATNCRAFLDEVVREHVELGYPEWVPPAPSPPRVDMQMQMQMSPMGGGGGLAGNSNSMPPGPMTQAAAEWSGSPAQYGSVDMQQQQQYSAQTNGNTGQLYGRAGVGGVQYPSVASHPQLMMPAAAGNQQVRFCVGWAWLCGLVWRGCQTDRPPSDFSLLVADAQQLQSKAGSKLTSTLFLCVPVCPCVSAAEL